MKQRIYAQNKEVLENMEGKEVKEKLQLTYDAVLGDYVELLEKI